jgi:hypothetical protein
MHQIDDKPAKDGYVGLFHHIGLLKSLTIGLFIVFITPFIYAHSAHATQTVPYKINFQGRLTDSSGNIKPNGVYSMKFRLFSALSGGSALWTETRDHTSGQQVTVTNGLFSVQLGDVQSLSASLFSSGTYPLYLEVELPTPGTATCTSNGCETWTEGAMSPRSAFGSSGYAFNADQVDGIDGSSLARNDTSNNYNVGTTNTFNGQLVVNNTANVTNNTLLGFNIQGTAGAYTLQNTGVGGYIYNDANSVHLGVTDQGSAGASVSPVTGGPTGQDAIILTTIAGYGGTGTAIRTGFTYGPNLVDNGSFEGRCAGWNSNSNCAVDTSVVHSGTNSVKYVMPSPTSADGQWSFSIAAQPGDTFYAEGWLRTSAATTGHGSVELCFEDKNANNLGCTESTNTNPGTTWTKRTVTATAPANATDVFIGSFDWGDGTTAGTWYFDDLYLAKVNHPENMVVQNDSASALQVQNAAGTVTFFNVDTTGNNVQIGSTTLATGTQTVNIGTNNTAGSTTNVTIGSGSSATAGTTAIQSKGSTTISTNGTTRATFDNSGNLTLSTNNTINGVSTFNNVAAFNVDTDYANNAYIAWNQYYNGSNYIVQNTGTSTQLYNEPNTGFNLLVSSNKTAGSLANSQSLVVGYAPNDNLAGLVDNGISYGNNLVSNPGFELGCAGWLACGLTATDDPSSGLSEYKYTMPLASSTYDITSRKVAVQPGDQLYTSVKVKTSAATTGQGGLYVHFYDASGASLSFSDGDYTNPGTSYITKSWVHTVPAGAAYAALSLTVRGDLGAIHATTAGTWKFDNAYMSFVNRTGPSVFRSEVNAAGAFQVQDAGSNAIVSVDTSLNSASINAINARTLPTLQITQASTGDASLSVGNTTNTYSIGVDASDSNTLKIGTYATTGTSGPATYQATSDSNKGTIMLATLVQATTTGTVSTLHVHLGASVAGTVQAALYADASSPFPRYVPGTLLAGSSPAITPTANSWNNFTIASQSVTAGTYYWVALYVTSNTTQVSYAFTTDGATASNLAFWPGSWTNWPGSYSSQSGFGYAMTMDVTAGSMTDQFAMSPFSVSSTGKVKVKPTTDSTSAFAIQDSRGESLFTADTTNSSLKVMAGDRQFTDLVTIDNATNQALLNNVNALHVLYTGGSANSSEGAGLRVDTSISTGTSAIVDGLRIVASNGASSGQSLYGIKLEAPTSPGSGQETAQYIGTGWDLGIDIQSGGLQLASQSDPSAPAASNLKIYSQDIVGSKTMLTTRDSTNAPTQVQNSLMGNRIAFAGPGAGSGTTPSVFGTSVISPVGGGTINNPNPTSTNRLTATHSMTYSTTASSGNVMYQRQSTLWAWTGNSSGLGGFLFDTKFGLGATQFNNRVFIGLSDNTATFTNLDPTSDKTYGKIGMAINSASGNWNFVTNAAGGATINSQTLGSNIPVNTTDLMDLLIYCPPNGSTIYYKVTDLSTGNSSSGSSNTSLPSNTTFMAPYFFITNNGINAIATLNWASWYLESDT